MSLPPSTFGRSTPTNVPASQNTAPVIKFRCLYTHDIRRKAKRWQDGYLKYHTFNKRAMIYDGTGNFIGDHHWRESHDIQDGDELELDKGVLIQVGECMETTQTDISVLFDKRKASQESPQSRKTPAPQPLPSGSNISLPSPYAKPSALARPVRQFNPLKPLHDVLGIQRGPIGRSVTPQSPYEQCHRQQRPGQRTQEDEPPAKRQKATPASDILQQRSTNEPVRSRAEAIDSNSPTFAKPPSKALLVSSARKNVEIAAESPRLTTESSRRLLSQQTPSRGQSRQESQRPASNTILPGSTRQSLPINTSRQELSRPEAQGTTEKIRNQPSKPRESLAEPTSGKEQSRSVAQRTPAAQTPAQDAPNVQTASARPQALSEISQPVINSDNIPVNPLRMSNEKPRQKLMYRALLPRKDVGEAQANSNPIFDQDLVGGRDLDFPLSATTLAVLEETNLDASDADDMMNVDVNNVGLIPEQIQTPKVSRTQNSQSRLLNRIPTHASVYGPFASPAGVELRDDTEDDMALLLASSPSGPDNGDTGTLSAGQRAPVMRSNSDISHLVPESVPARSVPIGKPASVEEALPTTALKKSDRVFRKWNSDTNALRNLDNANDGLSRPLATAGPPRDQRAAGTVITESGPWTADALDFFDWWPPGRPMPV